MSKPEDLPPRDGVADAAAATPAPELTVTDELGSSEADPTLEWNIGELPAADGVPDDPAASVVTPHPVIIDGVDGNGHGGAVSVVDGDAFVWGTPTPLPEVPTAPVLLEDELQSRPVWSRERSDGAFAERLQVPAEIIADGPGEAPARLSELGEVGEEDLEIVETSFTPAPTAVERPRPRPPAPPPVPPAAQVPPPPAAAAPRTTTPASSPILIPQLPPEGAVPPTPAPSSSAGWPEALTQRPRKKRLKPWFEEVFDEDYLRTLPFMTADQTLREVAFIKDALSPPADGQVLDVACGYGRHAIELSQRGLRVTGLDLSLPLLIRAADESQRRALSVNFVHADMREMTFDSQFDGAYCMLSSFGYFDEETNLRVATSICRALKPGGRFLLDTVNRDYIVSDLPTRVWWEGDGCVVLEEVDFNFHTSRVVIRRSVVFQDGRQVEQDISIRAYSLHELGKLLRQAGFRVLDVSGSVATKGHFFGATSRNIMMVCERPVG